MNRAPAAAPAQPGHNYVLPETTLLVVICALDLLSTVYLVATKQAIEANPLMRWVLDQYGPNGFIAVKAAFMAVPLVIAELARKHNPNFVRLCLRVGIVAYVTLYALSFAARNGGQPQ
jgi:hypothetical protein